MSGIEVYTTSRCPWCVRARALPEDKGHSYREIDLTGDRAGLRDLALRTGRRTVPQIFIGGAPMGGYEDLRRLQLAGGPG